MADSLYGVNIGDQKGKIWNDGIWNKELEERTNATFRHVENGASQVHYDMQTADQCQSSSNLVF